MLVTLSLFVNKEMEVWEEGCRPGASRNFWPRWPAKGGDGHCWCEHHGTAAGDGPSAVPGRAPWAALQTQHCSSALTRTTVLLVDSASQSPHQVQGEGLQRGG